MATLRELVHKGLEGKVHLDTVAYTEQEYMREHDLVEEMAAAVEAHVGEKVPDDCLATEIRKMHEDVTALRISVAKRDNIIAGRNAALEAQREHIRVAEDDIQKLHGVVAEREATIEALRQNLAALRQFTPQEHAEDPCRPFARPVDRIEPNTIRYEDYYNLLQRVSSLEQARERDLEGDKLVVQLADDVKKFTEEVGKWKTWVEKEIRDVKVWINARS